MQPNRQTCGRSIPNFSGTILFCVYIVLSACQMEKDTAAAVADFNFDWKFSRGDIANAENPTFDDSGWRNVRLPHDWSVEESYTQQDAGGATAFLPGGIGWYRKSFKLPAGSSDKITTINFDGIYSNSEVWINGHYLGKRPYGYIGFNYDLTPHLVYGDEINTLAVKADRSAWLDCRWYPGSGIYRKVRLETVDKIHIPTWGTFITTPMVTDERAEVSVENTVENHHEISKNIVLKTVIMHYDQPVAETSNEITLDAGEKSVIKQRIKIEKPRLWDTENPHLYQARTSIIDNEAVLDEYTNTFGIRDIKYDAEKGFFLNGKQTIFKGVCLHHDGGLVGAAVPEGVWERRLLLLKEAGCNAIRTAHNPPSEEFLDLCDRMGFLVQDEAFDEWHNPKDKRHNYSQQEVEEVTRGYTEHFPEWAERDIKNMVLRDRNHPSIVMWSILREVVVDYWILPVLNGPGIICSNPFGVKNPTFT